MTEMVWHYTRMDFLDEILNCGELRPTADRLDHSNLHRGRQRYAGQPLLWFSANQQWEYLSEQLISLHDKSITWQQLASAHGAIRFGLPATAPRLLNWKETIAVGFNRQERRSREKVAKKAARNRSDANKWFTTTVPIPLTQLRFQTWVEGDWIDYKWA